jgi:hypothetical protein
MLCLMPYTDIFFISSMFLEPIRAASYRGHTEIVKLLMVDHSDGALHSNNCSTIIVNFFNDHTELLNLTLGPLWQGCGFRPRDTHDLRRLALNETRNLEMFKQLLKDAKSHFAMHDPYWFLTRTHTAAKQGQADIVKYMIEEERVDVDDDKSVDRSIFLSRYPVEFRKGFLLQDRPGTLLDIAARGGHGDAVKILLDAGAKPDHGIEFAAMCGSRTLVRLLWAHDEFKNDAVQGALAIAVDREDTAVFNLLKELGARLDDDVRVAMTQKAQEEGLESMVRLLDEDAHASAAGFPD